MNKLDNKSVCAKAAIDFWPVILLLHKRTQVPSISESGEGCSGCLIYMCQPVTFWKLSQFSLTDKSFKYISLFSTLMTSGPCISRTLADVCQWSRNNKFESVNGIFCPPVQNKSELSYWKSSALHRWLHYLYMNTISLYLYLNYN
jgi:hypothetical protein